MRGALEFGGIDDYVATPFVLDPVDGPFSVYAWVRGEVPGRVILSQMNDAGPGRTWIGTDSVDGKLLTNLVPPTAGRFPPPPLLSETVITDGQWHHIGLVWDGSLRHLYVDDAEVAQDDSPLDSLDPSQGALYIGAGEDLDAASFWSGLIDDVRIYDRAVTP